MWNNGATEMKYITIENPRQCRFRLCLAREVYKCNHPDLKSSEPLSLLCRNDVFEEACPLTDYEAKELVEKSFEFEPTTKEMTAENKANVLGGQGNLWTECIYSSKLAEYMIFPRLCAIAEKLWNCEGNTDYSNFLERLNIHKKRLYKKNEICK
mgnify:CR=1 FL=1